MMKNKLFIILISLILLQPVSTAVENNVELPQANTEAMETVENSDTSATAASEAIKENKTDITKQTDLKLPHKRPTSKKKIIKKFLIAMISVAGSSLLIYIGLTIYNRIRSNFKYETEHTAKENNHEEPENLNDALKSFLDNTRWE